MLTKHYLLELLEKAGTWKVLTMIALFKIKGYVSDMEAKQWFRWVKPYCLRKTYQINP
jgi:hypothetical protein